MTEEIKSTALAIVDKQNKLATRAITPKEIEKARNLHSKNWLGLDNSMYSVGDAVATTLYPVVGVIMTLVGGAVSLAGLPMVGIPILVAPWGGLAGLKKLHRHRLKCADALIAEVNRREAPERERQNRLYAEARAQRQAQAEENRARRIAAAREILEQKAQTGDVVAEGARLALTDPLDQTRKLMLQVSEVADYEDGASNMRRITARLYEGPGNGELSKCPEIEGIGPIIYEQPVTEDHAPLPDLSQFGAQRPPLPFKSSSSAPGQSG